MENAAEILYENYAANINIIPLVRGEFHLYKAKLESIPLNWFHGKFSNSSVLPGTGLFRSNTGLCVQW